MSRTHNNLFRDLKSILKENGKWKTSEETEKV